MKILGIETSCDETSAAIVEDLPAGRQVGLKLLSHVVASSADLQIKYGGIVPEVAARKQVEVIIPVLTEALNNIDPNEIDAIAVTIGPGLIGSLLVGVETAKTLAMVWNKPIIPVNHVLAHIYAVSLEDYTIYSSSERSESRSNNKQPTVGSRLRSNNKIKFPAIALVVSGGHTELYLMSDEKTLKWLGGTLDDAAGECFDKTARLLGLPYPGGPAIAAAAEKYSSSESHFLSDESRSNHIKTNVSSRLPARQMLLHQANAGGRSNNIHLPRPMLHNNSLNFSFSGLKTAVLREWKKYKEGHSRESGNLNIHVIDPRVKPEDDKLVCAFAHEIQESITDVLVAKTLKAAEKYQAKSVIVTGGVAANKRLSSKFKVQSSKFKIFVPPAQFCVDSASYIAAAAFYRGQPQSWKTIEAKPDLKVEIQD